MSLAKVQYDYICKQAKEATLLHTAADALEWDERTGMPPAAGDYRAQQVACLRGLAHQRRTDSRYADYLSELNQELSGNDPSDLPAATVKCLHRDLQRDQKLSTKMIEHLSALTVRGQQNWDAARKNNRFSDFQKTLEQIVNLKREIGSRLREGTENTAYEALIDEYEPNATVKHLDQLFQTLREPLVELIQRIQDAPRRPETNLFQRALPIKVQREISRYVATQIGFDFDRGRLDETSHPFCTTLGPDDCRILTRYDPNHLASGLFGTMHEAGHGVYEQGLLTEWFGLPPGSYASLGIHESQSRMWENQVGRSQSFWKWLTPELKKRFAPEYDGASADELYFAANAIEPSLIRVEADEATYNLHIIIRYDLEKQLIDGALQVDDLPSAWNDRYKQDLGVNVTQDSQGVLQDVHWSAGLIGYFPTYTIGNLISAQLFASAQHQLVDLEEHFSRGSFRDLLEWTRKRVHQYGRTMTSDELVQQATGETLSSDHLVSYLKAKLEPLYGI